MAIEKLKEKAAWQLYAGAKNVPPETANEISRYIDKYNETLKYADEEDYEFIHIEDYIPEEYIELYKQSKEYQGIVINLKVHACGYLMLEGDIRRKIGLITAISETTGKRTLCACIEGNYLDAFGMVKNDFLIVDCVGLIKECFESIDKEVPTFDELRELIHDDKLTWEIYEKGITMCVNQVEKSSTSKKAQKYKMKNLAESSAFIAAIRPGFKSLLWDFLERKDYTTGESKIDEVLKDSFNYLIYQESIMKVLSYLGLSMGETYGVIKSISKKKLKGDKLKHLYEQLESGWKEKIGNIDNFSKVWQVIEDAARYSFNAPHSLSMGGDSAYLAWFKAHYTAKFYEVAIDHYQRKDKKDKIDSLVKEIIQFYNYKLGEYKFGNDNRKVNIDEKNKIIYPNLSSVKDMPKIVPDVLYKHRNDKFNNKFELYNFLINESGINKTGLEILIGLDYFSEFVDINQMYSDIEIFKKYYGSKTLNKEKLNELELKCIKSIQNKETAKQFKDFDSLEFIKLIIQSTPIKKTTIFDKIKYQVQYLGYTNLIDNKIPSDICVVLGTETNNWGNTFVNLYRIYDGFTKQFRANKKNYGIKCPTLETGDIIRCSFKQKQKQKMIGQDENGKNIYEKLNEYFNELNIWGKI